MANHGRGGDTSAEERAGMRENLWTMSRLESKRPTLNAQRPTLNSEDH
jgi:hypothetical protein